MKQKSRIWYVEIEEQQKIGKSCFNEEIYYSGAEATIKPYLSINNGTKNLMGIPIEE
jgi:hypothetical protein